MGQTSKEEWEVRPASSAHWSVSSLVCVPLVRPVVFISAQGGEGAAYAGVPLGGTVGNLQGTVCIVWNQWDTLFSFFSPHVKLWFGQG